MNNSFDRYKTRTWAEVDINALVNNYTLARRHLSEGTELLAVVKADAYGHGLENTVRLMNKKAVIDGFAVATPDEALALSHRSRAEHTYPRLYLTYLLP